MKNRVSQIPRCHFGMTSESNKNPMLTKRVKQLYQTFDKSKTYPLAEAVVLVKKNATAKFDETIEVHMRLGIDPKKGEQQVRGVVVLPNSFGKSKTVAAFVPRDRVKDAKEAGADFVYTDDDIENLKKTGKIEFDIAVSMPEMMKTISPLARILGPRGLMPSPKNETITTNLAKTISELKKGKVAYKNDDTANLHQAVGKAGNTEEQLLANLSTFIDAVKKSKPETSKGVFIKSITICSTMGPAIKTQI